VSIEQGAPIENPPNNEEEMYKFYEASDIEDYVSFSENDNLLPLYIECLPSVAAALEPELAESRAGS
jgi:hypothetical protein